MISKKSIQSISENYFSLILKNSQFCVKISKIEFKFNYEIKYTVFLLMNFRK